MSPRGGVMLGLLLSTIAFFVAGAWLRRSLDRMDIPRGMTRGVVIVTGALLAAYLVAAAVKRLPL